MKCPECNGLGKVRIDPKISFRNYNICGFCKGKQYLDWIEYILGVDSNYWKINEANWYKE